MKIAESVPYEWYERKISNPWYDHSTMRVVMPTAIRDKRNIMLTEDELKAYESILVEFSEMVQGELGRVKRSRLAWERGRWNDALMGGSHPMPVTLCWVLEFMVRIAKMKLAVLQHLTSLTGRAVSVVKSDIQGESK